MNPAMASSGCPSNCRPRHRCSWCSAKDERADHLVRSGKTVAGGAIEVLAMDAKSVTREGPEIRRLCLSTPPRDGRAGSWWITCLRIIVIGGPWKIAFPPDSGAPRRSDHGHPDRLDEVSRSGSPVFLRNRHLSETLHAAGHARGGRGHPRSRRRSGKSPPSG